MHKKTDLASHPDCAEGLGIMHIKHEMAEELEMNQSTFVRCLQVKKKNITNSKNRFGIILRKIGNVLSYENEHQPIFKPLLSFFNRIKKCFGWLVVFFGISNLESYLMPNPVYIYKTYL